MVVSAYFIPGDVVSKVLVSRRNGEKEGEIWNVEELHVEEKG